MTIFLGPSRLLSPSSILFESSHCQSFSSEGMCCSMLINSGNRHLLDGRKRGYEPTSIRFRCRNPLFGAVQVHWLLTGHETFPSKVCVASDYSDSVPDSSSYIKTHGYHPLEEVKESDRSREARLSLAEIARTTVEANNKALVVFPGTIHCEPHGHISWNEFQYYIDEYGDIFLEIFDDENILKDSWAINPVNALIGMDIPLPVGGWPSTSHDDGSHLTKEETVDLEIPETHVDRRIPDSSHSVHPLYFAKCLTKAIKTISRKRMDLPSNRISIFGCLTPALMEEESNIRMQFHVDNSDDYSNWKDDPEREEEEVTDSYGLNGGEMSSINSLYNEEKISSRLYKLEIISIELLSVYGVQAMVYFEDFQEAKPDILVHSASAIVEHFEKRMKCNSALIALCRKKGYDVEGAYLIGVDSLGMDVRVFFGAQVQTLRFSFKTRAKSGSDAEKKIQRLLFPRSQRKKINISI